MTKTYLAAHASFAATEPRLCPDRLGRLSPVEEQTFDALDGRRLERTNAEFARALTAEARPGETH